MVKTTIIQKVFECKHTEVNIGHPIVGATRIRNSRHTAALVKGHELMQVMKIGEHLEQRLNQTILAQSNKRIQSHASAFQTTFRLLLFVCPGQIKRLVILFSGIYIYFWMQRFWVHRATGINPSR